MEKPWRRKFKVTIQKGAKKSLRKRGGRSSFHMILVRYVPIYTHRDKQR